MRMPILSYFGVIGAILGALLNLSAYALPDVGSPIKTSQLTGLPKLEPRFDAEPMMPRVNFAARKELAESQPATASYAKADSSAVQPSGHLTRQKPIESKPKRSPPEKRVAASSYDAMLAIH
jgi:hypothetical protein